jgi:hypothetical protein
MKSISQVQQSYQEKTQNKNFNALVYGGTGTGKTTLFTTARRPVYVYIFDPGGEVSIRDEIAQGWIIADTRFQSDDPKEPKAYKEWEKDFNDKRHSGFFEMFATVGFDSLSTWSDLIMNRILKDMGRAPGQNIKYEGQTIQSYGVPFQQDYNPEMATIKYMVKLLMTLPCDVIFTAHPVKTKDDVTGKMFIGPSVTGRLKETLPLLFTEIYAAVTNATAGGINYQLLTRNDGLYMARTRLGKGGIFDTYEKPDIKSLLKKAKMSVEDKVIPWLTS